MKFSLLRSKIIEPTTLIVSHSEHGVCLPFHGQNDAQSLQEYDKRHRYLALCIVACIQLTVMTESGDFGVLPELHAVSSGLKAICTWMTAGMQHQMA
jgi:hypothetical protein